MVTRGHQKERGHVNTSGLEKAWRESKVYRRHGYDILKVKILQHFLKKKSMD
jgi:hypothetical protein